MLVVVTTEFEIGLLAIGSFLESPLEALRP